MTITVPNLPYSFAPAPLTAPKQGFMFKNAYDAFFYDYSTASATQITDKEYPGYHPYPGAVVTSVGTVATVTMPKQAITTLTGVKELATAVTSAAHDLTTGDLVTIEGVVGVPLTITSLTQTGGTALAACAGHTFAVGNVVLVENCVPESYSGAQLVTAVSAGVSFSYKLASTTVTSPATYLIPAVPATETNQAVAAVAITATLSPAITISSIARSGQLATVTTSGAHGFRNDQIVTVMGATAATKVVDVSAVATTVVNGYPTAGGSPALALNFTTPHGYVAGTLVRLSGASYEPYNGEFVITYVSSLYFIVEVPSAGGGMGASVMSVTRAVVDFNGVKFISVLDSTHFTYIVQGTEDLTASGATLKVAADFSGYKGLKEVTVTAANAFTYWIAGVPPATAPGSTKTFQAAHGFGFGDNVVVSGATPSAYNGTYAVTATQMSAFTYTFAGGTSPAIGAVVSGGAMTVPGIVALDSYFIVMDTRGRLHVSDSGQASRWNGLAFNQVQQETGAGVALARSGNYVIALKEWSTEVFYNAGASPGSPLAPMLSSFAAYGCAAGESLATVSGDIFWVAQTKQHGRSVRYMSSLQIGTASTASIDRILEASTLATVYSFGIVVSGHAFYVLTLVDLNITLVYDKSTQLWSTWTSLTAAATVAISSVVITNGVAVVVTAAAHGVNDGDPVDIAGCTPAVGTINGRQCATYISATSYSFTTTATGTVTRSTATSGGFTETYFKYVRYINAFGKDLLQHETNGTVGWFTDTAFTDGGLPINMLVRTPIVDGGSSARKFFGSIEVIGDKIAGEALVRYSGQDYANPVKYRKVNLASQRARIVRCGMDNRRSFELRYWGSAAFRATELDIEVEVDQG